MKIAIACDSFKGSAATMEVAAALKDGILGVASDAQVITIPVADGGEGTTKTLVDALHGTWKQVQVHDPLSRLISAKYGVFADNYAIMEMAEASGITLISPDERNPFETTTFGVGEMILDALNIGIRKIYLGIGGSATNDAGIGLAIALGARALDKNGQDITPNAHGLKSLVELDMSGFDPRVKECEMIVLSDVSNPLCGSNGASAVFGPQKGASRADIPLLDKCLHTAGELYDAYADEKVSETPGAGAAGGLGAALLALTNASLTSGIDAILDLVDFDQKVEGADLIVTGEGRMDESSLSGKTPIGIARRAKEMNIPVIAVVGSRALHIDSAYDQGIRLILPIVNEPMSLEKAMQNVRALLHEAGKTAMHAFLNFR